MGSKLLCVVALSAVAGCSSAPDLGAEDTTSSTESSLFTVPKGPIGPAPNPFTPHFEHKCYWATQATPDSFFVRTNDPSKACTNVSGFQGTWVGSDAFPVSGSGECRYTWTNASGEPVSVYTSMDYDALAWRAALRADRSPLITADCDQTGIQRELKVATSYIKVMGTWVNVGGLEPAVWRADDGRPREVGCAGCRAVAQDGMIAIVDPISSQTAGQRLMVGFPGVNGYVPFVIDSSEQRRLLHIPSELGTIANGTDGTVYAQQQLP